jgi:hypothetical protein
MGLGSNYKSPSKGGKRIIQSYHVFKRDLIWFNIDSIFSDI